jgi:hypothetical protein
MPYGLFKGFNDNCVLVHGNFTLRSMLKDPRSDQLLAMVGPGMMLWAPREYELFRLAESGQEEAAVALPAPGAGGEAFLWRRWLYLLWDEVDNLVPGALTAPVSTWRQNHSCPGSPENLSAIARCDQAFRSRPDRCASARRGRNRPLPRIKR